MIADNMYLTILGETGIIGFFGFLIFIPFLLRKTWRQLWILEYDPKSKQQLLIILSAFIGLLVSMGGYELFYWPNQYMYFCILVGLLGVYCRNNKRCDIELIKT
jgi:O-antigen ligase